jgi:hypothetical protein
MEKMQNKQKRKEPPPLSAPVEDLKSELPNPLPAGTSSIIPKQTPVGAGVKKKKQKKKKGGPSA